MAKETSKWIAFVTENRLVEDWLRACEEFDQAVKIDLRTPSYSEKVSDAFIIKNECKSVLKNYQELNKELLESI